MPEPVETASHPYYKCPMNVRDATTQPWSSDDEPSWADYEERWNNRDNQWKWNPHTPKNGPVKSHMVLPDDTAAKSIIHVAISGPLKFEISKYESYLRDMMFWRDIHSSIEDSILTTTIATKCSGDLPKSIVTKFLGDTRGRRPRRAFGEFLKLIGAQFPKTAREIAMWEISLWTCSERRSGETI